jgi:tetratricopeptide (TPR) repeat protein
MSTSIAPPSAPSSSSTAITTAPPVLSEPTPASTQRYGVGRIIVVLVLLASLAVGGYFGGRYLWAQYHIRAGKKEFARQHYSKARAHLNLGLEVCKNDVEAHLLASRASRLMYDFDQSERHLSACKGQPDPDGRIKLEHELYMAERGEYYVWEPQLRKRVDADDPDTEAILEVMIYGNCHINRIQFVVEAADRILKSNPDHVYALLSKGEAVSQSHDRTGATDLFLHALEVDPDNEMAHLYLASTYLESNQPGKARDEYEILLQSHPDSPDFILSLARCTRLIGESQKALAMVDDLLRRRPGDPGALIERALDQYQLENGSAETEKLLRRAAQLAPTDRTVMFSFKRCLELRSVDPEVTATAAISACGGGCAFQAYDDNTEKAKIAKKMADMERQFELYNQLMRKIYKGGSKGFEDRLEAAQRAFDMGSDEEGLKWLRQIITMDTDNPDAHTMLSKYYERRGDVLMAHWHRTQAENGKVKMMQRPRR